MSNKKSYEDLKKEYEEFIEENKKLKESFNNSNNEIELLKQENENLKKLNSDLLADMKETTETMKAVMKNYAVVKQDTKATDEMKDENKYNEAMKSLNDFKTELIKGGMLK